MNILIVSNFELPNKSASASRSFEFAKIFSALGHNVRIIGTNYLSENDSRGVYEEFHYKNMGCQAKGNLYTKRINRIHKTKQKLINEIDKLNCENEIDILFLVGYIWDYHRVFNKISKKYRLKIISDVVEWHDRKSFFGFAAPIKFIQNRIALIFLLKKNKNLVCISTLLEDYYKKKNCNVVRVPTILDMKNYEAEKEKKEEKEEKEKIVISYAGMPRKKDRILNIIKGFSLLNENEKNQFEFRIFGPTLKELENSGVTNDLLVSMKELIVCKGNIPKEDVVKELKKTDFTILLRPNKRYANAGFPTKVGESLASGVPVITNITSDLGLYLEDNYNALIVKDDSPEECAEVLKKILTMDIKHIEKMKENALNDAYKYFDYHNYIEDICVFFDELQ